MDTIIMFGVGIIFFGLFYWIITFNSIVKTDVKVNEAESGIDVALSKRYSTLTNLYKVVGKYMDHEKEIFLKVAELRRELTVSSSISQKAQLDERLNELHSKMSIIVEAYPELKADSVVRELQEAIIDAEDHLQAARRAYNANVSILNQKLLMFPSSLVANAMNKKQRKFYEANELEKENVIYE